MKRPASSLMSMCHNSDDEQSGRMKGVYEAELQSMLDGYDEEEIGHVCEKKRRLSVEQVKALEKNFEVENKLDPDRKVNLARELGLQPRQVAVWFQNRRARWKTKQLERDYALLKTNYDNLKLTFQTLQQDNQALLQQIGELKTKLQDDNSESNVSVEEEMVAAVEINDEFSVPPASEFDIKNNGSSDSDSSAVLNEDYSPPAAAAAESPAARVKQNYLQYGKGCQFQQQIPMLPKMEEHNYFSEDEACNFFSDEQAPTLHWWS